MERLIDLIANKLAWSRRGAAAQYGEASEMPYHNGIPYRDGEPIVFDSGDYPAALEKALEALGGLDVALRRRRV